MTTDHPSIPGLLRGSSEERQNAIRILVKDEKLKSEITAFIIRQSGSNDDALTIFHDSIIVFAKKIFTNRSLVIQGSFSSYIFGIAKNLWLLNLRKEKKHKMTDSLEDIRVEQQAEEDASFLFHKEKLSVLQVVLDKLGKPCKEVLMFWAGGYNMTEIAQKLGYNSDGVARKKKFFCFKSLMEWLEARPDTMMALKNEI